MLRFSYKDSAIKHTANFLTILFVNVLIGFGIYGLLSKINGSSHVICFRSIINVKTSLSIFIDNLRVCFFGPMIEYHFFHWDAFIQISEKLFFSRIVFVYLFILNPDQLFNGIDFKWCLNLTKLFGDGVNHECLY